MKRIYAPSDRLPRKVWIPLCLLTAFASLAAWDRPGLAANEFQQLVSQIPPFSQYRGAFEHGAGETRALGLKENWSAKVEQAFESGLVRVPPQATRFVLASQIDFDFMEPLWEAAVIELSEDLSTTQIEKMRHGTLDTIEGLPAIARSNDTYIVKLAPKMVGAMAPANRQTVVRWIREVRKPSPPPLSSYLQRAAVYSDEAGSEIIMAMDLDGVMSFERVAKYLKSHKKDLDVWQAKDESPTSLNDVAKLLSNIQGIRIGVRIGEKQSSKIVVELPPTLRPSPPSRSRYCSKSWRIKARRLRTFSHGPLQPRETRFH